MKSLIALLTIGVVLLLILGAAVVPGSHKAEAREKPWLEPGEQTTEPVFYEHCCECDYLEQKDQAANDCQEIVETADIAEYQMSQERMVAEVEMLWNMWFDDEGASPADPRRDRFTEFAEYLVDAALMYRDKPTDIGGQFPGAKNDHLVLAYIAAKESSVTPDVVNKNGKGEVCLMQLHGAALAGYASDKVLHNPRLCLLLGARWLAAQIPKCEQDGAGGIYGDEFSWEDSDWVGPLSVYAGGERGIRKDGRCARFKVMKERISAVRLYRIRIDHAMENWVD